VIGKKISCEVFEKLLNNHRSPVSNTSCFQVTPPDARAPISIPLQPDKHISRANPLWCSCIKVVLSKVV
jgi:hypothetical protein